MISVAVLGGGPAGASAAARLAAAGVEVALFDEKLAWEKPCGGGITSKAYHRYPFLIDNDVPKRLIREAVLSAPGAGSVVLPLGDPLLIYSRLDLNRLLLDRAERAGAHLEKTRVLDIRRDGAGWQLRTRSGTHRAAFCIVGTGARNALRDLGTHLAARDTMSTQGYYVPGDRERLDVRFIPGFEGYIWVFPRCGHLSVGICGRGEPAAALRARLQSYMRENGLDWNGAGFYSHLLPSLAAASWKTNRVAGEGWIAAGDAAGLVDPVTGEGIYYAIRSGDLAASAFLESNGDPAPAAVRYRHSLRRDFADDLATAARLSSRFFRGRFLLGPVTSRMVQFARRSETFRALVRDLFAGSQDYRGLKRRLYAGLPRTAFEIASGRG